MHIFAVSKDQMNWYDSSMIHVLTTYQRTPNYLSIDQHLKDDSKINLLYINTWTRGWRLKYAPAT